MLEDHQLAMPNKSLLEAQHSVTSTVITSDFNASSINLLVSVVQKTSLVIFRYEENP